MKKISLFLTVLLIAVFSCKNSNNEQKQNSKQDTVVVIELKNLENAGDSLVGQEIQISGFVSHVCHEDGKKLMLWDSVADVRLKVITETPFDTTLEGQVVSIIGILNAKPFTMQDYRDLEKKMRAHHPDGLDKDDSLRLVSLFEKLKNSADSTIKFYTLKFERFVK